MKDKIKQSYRTSKSIYDENSSDTAIQTPVMRKASLMFTSCCLFLPSILRSATSISSTYT